MGLTLQYILNTLFEKKIILNQGRERQNKFYEIKLAAVIVVEYFIHNHRRAALFVRGKVI